jgi:uncharacterized membrane protein
MARAHTVAPSRVLAVTVDSPERAHDLLHRALELQDRGALVVHDAVMARGRAFEHDDDAIDPTPVFLAVPASVVGAVIGTLVLGPFGLLLGGVLGGGAAAIAAKWLRGRFPRAVLDEVSAVAAPGQCVLALLVDAGGEAAFAELARGEGAEPLRLRAA